MIGLLHCKRYGEGDPVFILHGLFGSWDNWYPVARELSRGFCVYVPDLRNHGRSFHSPLFDYDVMAGDLQRLMDVLGVECAAFIGHSMGGKAAMRLAGVSPQRLQRLIVVDITHKAYPPAAAAGIQALARLDLKSVRRLKDAEERLRPDIPDPALRLFLLKNLDRLPNGVFRWKVNLDAIRDNLDRIYGPVAIHTCRTRCLFIRGARSDYIRDTDWTEVKRIFPRADLATIPAAGHWVHMDAKTAFLDTVRQFLIRP
jgi:pimeloyl-ACP methyl ester carboxylesterase